MGDVADRGHVPLVALVGFGAKSPVGWWACRTDKHSTVTMVNCAVLDFTFCNSAVAQKIK